MVVIVSHFADRGASAAASRGLSIRLAGQNLHEPLAISDRLAVLQS